MSSMRAQPLPSAAELADCVAFLKATEMSRMVEGQAAASTDVARTLVRVNLATTS